MKRIGLLVLSLLAVSQLAAAEAPSFDASMKCAAAAGPGRVHCDAEVHPPPGARISWADLVIVESPTYVAPLKARIPPSDATESRDDTWRWAFAVVAKSRGKGDLKARTRVVICRGDECTTATRDVSAVVSAGE